jgi:hypothetical protein
MLFSRKAPYPLNRAIDSNVAGVFRKLSPVLKGWLLRKHRLQESPSLSPRVFYKNPERVGQVELPTRVGSAS